MADAAQLQPTTIASLDGEWRLAVDPDNVGRDQRWFEGPVSDARAARVPGIIQEAFPYYHGLAWYWRQFDAPENPHDEGRFLLRFWAVDYISDVWVNGQYVGGHEGPETPFVLDITDVVRPAASNDLAVCVLNPKNEPIDGVVLGETPHRSKVIPLRSGATGNHGGIEDSVELMTTGATRIEDLSVRPDPKTGVIRIAVEIENATRDLRSGSLRLSVSPATSGETLASGVVEGHLRPGNNRIDSRLEIAEPHLWDLDDPYLYRVSAHWRADRSASIDEQTTRCGFRDFRFENGAFRLNGRPIFLRSSHTGNHCPIGLWVPTEPDLIRRGLVQAKAMGMNMVRWLAGVARRDVLDLCDEIGLMMYQESSAGWCLRDSPRLAERFDRSTTDMIRRDGNHASITIWGLLNETGEGPVFRHAVGQLPLIRAMDNTRMVLLSSGRWDKDPELGSLSNPDSLVFETDLSDEHHYPRVPHTADIIRLLRTVGHEKEVPVFLSEYGIGSAVDLPQTARNYEQRGEESVEDAEFLKERLDGFMADWDAWGMTEAFGRPEDYFRECIAKMAGQRLLGLNAVRANPNIVGYSLTSTVNPTSTGEGLVTSFRELKPGTADAMFDGLAPLRWCLFVEPIHAYCGSTLRLEAVLANEDALSAGEYPARLEVFSGDGARVFERSAVVTVPDRAAGVEPPLSQPILDEEIVADWPAGKYRFVATFERGAAASGGDVAFYLGAGEDMPEIGGEISLWGEDAEVRDWLGAHDISAQPLDAASADPGQAILVGQEPPASGKADVFGALKERVEAGATAVFLSPEVFKDGDDPVHWLPLEDKGSLTRIHSHIYLKDEWAKRHPIFEGLQAGGLMDLAFYREIIPDAVWSGQDPPDEAVAGAIKSSQGYSSGLMVSVYRVGSGRIILNTLKIRENLGTHPAAERLLRNMLRYAAARED